MRDHDVSAVPARRRQGRAHQSGRPLALLAGPVLVAALIACGGPGLPSAPQAAQTAVVAATQVSGVAGTAQAAAGQLSGTAQAAAGQVSGTAAALATQVAPIQGTAQAQVVPTVQAALTQVAPTVQVVSTQAVGTAQAAATQLAPTVQAAATQVAPAVAPAVGAASTQIAPAIQAISTQIAGPAGGLIATQVASGPVQISAVQRGTADTTVTLRNSGSSALDLAGYMLVVPPTMVTMPAAARVPANGTLTLHFSPGTNSATDVYVTGTAPKAGDVLVLVTNQGAPVSIFAVP